MRSSVTATILSPRDPTNLYTHMSHLFDSQVWESHNTPADREKVYKQRVFQVKRTVKLD